MKRTRKDKPDTWTKAERSLLRGLSTPAKVQDYLDELTYRAEYSAACPRGVIEEGRAHCFDGATFAAAALELQGHPPMLLDMWAERDDDHVLAVYRVDDHFGTIAKSNFSGLRSRQPVYRTLRELAMSYFDCYFNLENERSLRAYSRLLDLRRFDDLRWRFDDEAMPVISERLDALTHYPVVSKKQLRRTAPVDSRLRQAGMVGTLLEGVYGAS